MRIIHLPDGFDTTIFPGNRHTLIHELGHVWQGEVTGPYYMGHALFSQVTLGNAGVRLRRAGSALVGEHGGRWEARPLQPGAAGAGDRRLLHRAEGRQGPDDGLRSVHRGGAVRRDRASWRRRGAALAVRCCPLRARARAGRARCGWSTRRRTRPPARGGRRGGGPAASSATPGAAPRTALPGPFIRRHAGRARACGLPLCPTSAPGSRAFASAAARVRAPPGLRGPRCRAPAAGAAVPAACGADGGEPAPWGAGPGFPAAALDVRADHERRSRSRPAARGRGGGRASTSATAGRRGGPATTGCARGISSTRPAKPARGAVLGDLPHGQPPPGRPPRSRRRSSWEG